MVSGYFLLAAVTQHHLKEKRIKKQNFSECQEFLPAEQPKNLVTLFDLKGKKLE